MCFLYFRYGFEGMLQSIYGNGREINKCSKENCLPVTGESVLADLDTSFMSFATIVIILVAWILCLHVTIYSILRWKLYKATK